MMMAEFMRASGRITRNMDLESIRLMIRGIKIARGLCTKGSFWMVRKMDMEKLLGKG
jgi:hypothetical protein